LLALPLSEGEYPEGGRGLFIYESVKSAKSAKSVSEKIHFAAATSGEIGQTLSFMHPHLHPLIANKPAHKTAKTTNLSFILSPKIAILIEISYLTVY
jgi:hypothetical protein